MSHTFNNTTIAVVVIPPTIWEQDKGTWKAWVTSIDVSFKTKETYKRSITHFYALLELPILEVTEQHINDYEKYLRESGKTERTVRSNMTPIRQYWQFAQVQREMAGEA